MAQSLCMVRPLKSNLKINKINKTIILKRDKRNTHTDLAQKNTMARFRNREPKLTPWRSSRELLDLRTLLFPRSEATCVVSLSSDTIDSQRDGISKIKAYQTKMRISHCISITGQLISAQHELHILQMGNLSDSEILLKEEQLKLSISMAIIRFVNGLLDPSQQSQYAIPLNVLARKINLPNWFVELRHSGTHENLSSLEMLEIAVDGAVEWTYLNYWVKLDEKEVYDDESDEEVKELEELLKSYRRMRRDNLKKVFKVGDKTDAGKEYWKIVIGICEKFENNETLVSELLIKFLIKYKFEQGKLLYLVLVDYLYQRHFDKVLKIIEVMLEKLYEFDYDLNEEDDDTSFLKITNNKEVKTVENWLNWLVLEEFDVTNQETNTVKLVDLLGRFNNPIPLEILKKLQTKELSPTVDDRITSKLRKRTIESEASQKRPMDEIDIDSIAKDLERLKKRVKLSKGEKKPKVFERYENWEPKPFGVL